ncbi:hypothetical protein DIPPA_33501 [Diplonema papillatum]|nr:hypothetical protein DIPPA_33501 [Diplonema papillatum]
MLSERLFCVAMLLWVEAGCAQGPPVTILLPHLEVTLSLPVASSDQLLDGFKQAAVQALAAALYVETGSVDNPSIVDGTSGTGGSTVALVADVYAAPRDFAALRGRLSEAVDAGLLIAGVRVTAVSTNIVADNAEDECEANPCGPDQTCEDRDFEAAGDFICSCSNGRTAPYPTIGRPSPSCSRPMGTVADVAEVFEVFGLCSGATALVSLQNAFLHATECEYTASHQLPLAFHPTQMTVKGNVFAGCVLGNTILLASFLALQHFLAAILSNRQPAVKPEAAILQPDRFRRLLGYPQVTIRVFIVLLPSTVFACVALLGESQADAGADWPLVLGTVMLGVWVGGLSCVLYLEAAARCLFASFGTHYFSTEANMWRRKPLNPEYFALLIGLTTATALTLGHSVGARPLTCSGQRYTIGVLTLISSFATLVLLRPLTTGRHWSVFVSGKAIPCFVGGLQGIAFFCLASGIRPADGIPDRSDVDASVVLRLVSAVSTVLWMFYRSLYARGGTGGPVVVSSPLLSYTGSISLDDEPLDGANPYTAEGVREQGLLPTAVLLTGDAAWGLVAVGIVAHWAFLIAAAGMAAVRLCYGTVVMYDLRSASSLLPNDGPGTEWGSNYMFNSVREPARDIDVDGFGMDMPSVDTMNSPVQRVQSSGFTKDSESQRATPLYAPPQIQPPATEVYPPSPAPGTPSFPSKHQPYRSRPIRSPTPRRRSRSVADSHPNPAGPDLTRSATSTRRSSIKAFSSTFPKPEVEAPDGIQPHRNPQSREHVRWRGHVRIEQRNVSPTSSEEAEEPWTTSRSRPGSVISSPSRPPPPLPAYISGRTTPAPGLPRDEEESSSESDDQVDSIAKCLHTAGSLVFDGRIHTIEDLFKLHEWTLVLHTAAALLVSYKEREKAVGLAPQDIRAAAALEKRLCDDRCQNPYFRPMMQQLRDEDALYDIGPHTNRVLEAMGYKEGLDFNQEAGSYLANSPGSARSRNGRPRWASIPNDLSRAPSSHSPLRSAFDESFASTGSVAARPGISSPLSTPLPSNVYIQSNHGDAKTNFESAKERGALRISRQGSIPVLCIEPYSGGPPFLAVPVESIEQCLVDPRLSQSETTFFITCTVNRAPTSYALTCSDATARDKWVSWIRANSSAVLHERHSP